MEYYDDKTLSKKSVKELDALNELINKLLDKLRNEEILLKHLNEAIIKEKIRRL